MKKIFFILIAFCLLVSCGSKEKVEEDFSSNEVVQKLIDHDNNGLYYYDTYDYDTNELMYSEIRGYDKNNNIELLEKENFVVDVHDVSIFKDNYRFIADFNKKEYYEDEGYKESIFEKISGKINRIIHSDQKDSENEIEEKLIYNPNYTVEENDDKIKITLSEDEYLLFDENYDLIESILISQDKKLKTVLKNKEDSIDNAIKKYEQLKNEFKQVDDLNELN